MSRRVIGRIIDGHYVDLEASEIDGTPGIHARTGPERSDYFAGVTPSKLKELSGPALYMADRRIYDTIVSNRGTASELANARDAHDAIIREARGRRASLHD